MKWVEGLCTFAAAIDQPELVVVMLVVLEYPFDLAWFTRQRTGVNLGCTLSPR